MLATEVSAATLDPSSLVELPAVAAPGGEILVVEDEPTIAQLLQHCLQRAGHRIRLAADGASALAAFAAGRDRIGLVLIDCHLPDLGGGDLARQLRELVPGLPLLMTSGRDQRTLVNALAAGGPTGFLPKPFFPAEILTRVRGLLAG